MTGLLICVVLLLLVGDRAGQPLVGSLTFQPEGPGGLPQISLAFQEKSQPVRAAAEAAFEITPDVPGDFSWQGSTLVFSPADRLESDTIYTVRLRGGLPLNGGGRSAYAGLNWSFQTRPARIAFLKKEGQAVNLWIGGAESGAQAYPLTFETARQVLDFTVSPGGERVVYSLAEPGGLEVSLWLVKTNPSPGERPRRLLQETGIRATAPRWSPGGDLIAYERRLLLGGGAFTQPQIWLIKPDGTSLAPLYGGSEHYGTGLNWASGGSKAFFWEPNKQALAIFNFADEPAWVNLAGVIPQKFSVSPDGRTILIARYDYTGPTQTEILTSLAYQKVAPNDPGQWVVKALPFSNQPGFNDSSPRWSPDGKLAAFLRKDIHLGASQIWFYEPASGKTWPATLALPGNTNPGDFEWSPDGQKLLFDTTSYNGQEQATEIWEIARAGSASRLVVNEGFGAKWIN